MAHESSYSNYHSQLESRLGTLETNAFTFVAVVVSVFVGLGVVYTEHATLISLSTATLGAILVLGFGAFYIQATTHAFRCVQLVMSRLEADPALGLAKTVPKSWCPDTLIMKGGIPSRTPEMLKVQSYFYLSLAISVVALLWVWAERHRALLHGWECYLLLASPACALFGVLISIWKYAGYLNGKQVNLLDELNSQRQEEAAMPEQPESTEPIETRKRPVSPECKSTFSWSTVFASLLVSFAIPFSFRLMDQREKAKWVAYEHKEARYRELISASRALQTSASLQNPYEAHARFLEQVDLCLMYCSDDVLRSLHGLIDRMKPENRAHYEGDTGTGQLKSMLLNIRRDVFAGVGMETSFTNDDIYLTSLVLKNEKGEKR